MNVESVIEAGINFYDHRGKRIALLAPGSSERDVAEKVQALRDRGVTYGEIVEQSHLSLSTCRRNMSRLLLTQAVERGEYDRDLKPLLKQKGPKRESPSRRAIPQARGEG